MRKFILITILILTNFCIIKANTNEFDMSNIKLTNSVGESYISNDGGKTWKPEVTERNDFPLNEILFTTNDGSQYLSKDTGKTWKQIINKDINNDVLNVVIKSKVENGTLKFSCSNNKKIDKIHIYDSKGAYVKLLLISDLNKVGNDYITSVDYLPDGLFFLIEERDGLLTLNSIFIK